MSLGKKISLAVLVILVLLQFVRPEKNLGQSTGPNEILDRYAASDTVKALIRTACYDCHSNNTRYPWYTNIQPIGLWLQHHVNEGKKELNFSEFTSYPSKKADHKLEESVEQIRNQEMPLSSYTLIHADAKLNDQQRDLVIRWIEEVRGSIQAAK